MEKKKAIIVLIVGAVLIIWSLIANLSYVIQNARSNIVILDAILTPIGIVGLVLLILGFIWLKREDKKIGEQNSDSKKKVIMLTEKEKKILKYFGPTFLLVIGLAAVFRVINSPNFPEAFVLILSPIVLICIIFYFVLGYKSAFLLRKCGKSKLHPIFWFLLLFLPISNIVTPIVLWVRNNKLLKENL